MSYWTPFSIDHLDGLKVQPRHADAMAEIVRLRDKGARAVTETAWAFTLWEGVTPVACGGVMLSGGTWALFGEDMRREMVKFTRFSQRVIRNFKRVVGPVWADIDDTHPEAVKWAKALGMTPAGGQKWVLA